MIVSGWGAIGIVAVFVASHLVAYGVHRLGPGGVESSSGDGASADESRSGQPISDRDDAGMATERRDMGSRPSVNAFSVLDTSPTADTVAASAVDGLDRAGHGERASDTTRSKAEDPFAAGAPSLLERLDSGTAPDSMASHALLADHRINRDHYHGLDPDQRYRTILELSGTGRDLDTIRDILALEDEPVLRAAALERLGVSPSFAGTTMLLGALDDPSSIVRSDALRTLVDSGDRSLLPILTERFHSLPAGSARDHFEEHLRRLELGVTMQMDGLSTAH